MQAWGRKALDAKRAAWRSACTCLILQDLWGESGTVPPSLPL